MADGESDYKPIFELNSTNDRPSSTSRKVHLRRLNDILYLSIERGDLHRARRVWAILVRCKEFDWRTKWRTGLLLLSHSTPNQQVSGQDIEFSRKLMRYYPDEQESILQEIILRLVHEGNFKEALDELEFYLPTFPYQDSPLLHSYAGLLSLKIATTEISESEEGIYSEIGALDTSLLVDAQNHFNRALSIDADNPVIKVFINELDERMMHVKATTARLDETQSDDEMRVDGNDPLAKGKRLKKISGGDRDSLSV